MEKKLTELNIVEFIDLLRSNAPAPGGGSASALIGAVGMGLGVMTASLTAGKKKYADRELLMQQAIADGSSVADSMIEGIDKDTDVFNVVMEAYGLPKTCDHDKEVRRNAIELATKDATGVPFVLMLHCAKAMDVLETLLGKINPSCASDLGVGALCIKTAVQGAWLNMLINLAGLSDEAFKEEYHSRGAALCTDICRRADNVYEQVLATL
ncbi:MAG: cyclodeaminase/cyclohydrolase family protein [Eubacteriales bacterium]|nr:cyclodeaminase/cyclohydrolase family protein [Eubacteriales bacterium]